MHQQRLDVAAARRDHQRQRQAHRAALQGPGVGFDDRRQLGGRGAVANAAVTHDDAVPELLLKAIENHGAGQFASVTYVQRLATNGGLAPKGTCTAGAEESVKYSATYTFYAAGG